MLLRGHLRTLDLTSTVIVTSCKDIWESNDATVNQRALFIGGGRQKDRSKITLLRTVYLELVKREFVGWLARSRDGIVYLEF